jgi:hypothetical protein
VVWQLHKDDVRAEPHIVFVQITNAILRSSGATNGTADRYFGFFYIVIRHSVFVIYPIRVHPW